MRKQFSFIIFITLAAVLSRYSLPNPSVEDIPGIWQYSDLRAIDPIDASDSGADIVAVLCQLDSETIKVRVDFLELSLEQNYDVYILIDSTPGGNQIAESAILQVNDLHWDYIIKYTQFGLVSIKSDGNHEINSAKLRVYRNYIEDYLEITSDAAMLSISKNTSLTIFTQKSSNIDQISDQIAPFLVEGLPPSPIDVSFLFWNVMDSSTPATILRSWAGAHTGPQSSRHGLSYLLSASRKWNMPISICDLYDRDIEFAIKYLQEWSIIDDLVDRNILNNTCFTNDNDYAKYGLIFMASNEELRESSSLLTALLTHYFSRGNERLIIGGDFSRSILGSPQNLNTIFSYITSHPWIRVVSNAETTSPSRGTYLFYDRVSSSQNSIPYTITGVPIPSGLTNLEIRALIQTKLSMLPQNNISTLAKQIFQNFVESTKENVTMAQGSYLSQLGHFFEAAHWAENPHAINTCLKDIDLDGQFECILASNNLFMTLELDGGYIAFLFAINSMGVHQIIGPTTQFGILRSDPSSLNSARGLAGDPGQIIGAFADPLTNLQLYNGISSPNKIELVSQNGDTHKSFSILDESIHILVTNDITGDITVRKLPIILDPWLIYTDTSTLVYRDLSYPTQWIWEAEDRVSLGVSADTNIYPSTFNASQSALAYPEDPNFDYTTGHLLPIPMALVEFQAQPTIVVDLFLDP
jgi:hypothetical protein